MIFNLIEPTSSNATHLHYCQLTYLPAPGNIVLLRMNTPRNLLQAQFNDIYLSTILARWASENWKVSNVPR